MVKMMASKKSGLRFSTEEFVTDFLQLRQTVQGRVMVVSWAPLLARR